MNRSFQQFIRPLIFSALLGAVPARATHYDIKNETDHSPIQCLVQDFRIPVFTDTGMYRACYSQRFQTKEGWGGYYYGGVQTHAEKKTSNFITSSWQMTGQGAPAEGIEFVHVGKHMSWQKSTWEGSAGGVGGVWSISEMRPNAWYRFVSRTWAPDGASPDHSFIGIWMKDLETGEWQHLSTVQYPGVISDLNNFYGFQEHYGGNEPLCETQLRNTYTQRDGRWTADNKCQLRPQRTERVRLKTIEDGKVLSLTTLWEESPLATAEMKADQAFQNKAQDVTYSQPAAPGFFDPIRVEAFEAFRSGGQILVRWRMAATSCPQLASKIEVFNNPAFGGTPLKTLQENDPELRSRLIDGNFPATVYVRLTLTDIYLKESAGGQGAVAPISLPAPTNREAAPVAGLAYRYYEAPAGTDWESLPDLDKLTPTLQGSVAEPDLTPRRSRKNYAFDFSGRIAVAIPGLYEFNLVCGGGAKLLVDGRPVIDVSDFHSIAKATGSFALAAGEHTLDLRYAEGKADRKQVDDYLQLAWTGPGFPDKPVRIPIAAYSHMPVAGGEPKLVVTPEARAGGRVKLTANVGGLAGEPGRVRYFLVNPGFDYFVPQGARGLDYCIGETNSAAEPLETLLWGSSSKTVRARLYRQDGRTVDSAPIVIDTGAPNLAPWTLSEVDHHQYPVGALVEGDAVSLVGESMSLLTQPVSGDCTLVAHLADLTSRQPAPDGSLPANDSEAGIILRRDLDPSPGEPLGGKTHYSSLLGRVDGSIRFCDSLMKNGAGNQPSADVGGKKRWLKIQRTGDTFTNSVSEDGTTWTVVKTVTLPKMGPTLYAGFFIYAQPAATPLLHSARFDHVSLSGDAGAKQVR